MSPDEKSPAVVRLAYLLATYVGISIDWLKQLRVRPSTP